MNFADHANARDRDERPFHYHVRKHAKAAATHRAMLREWVFKAHVAGIPHEEIAEQAGATLGQVTSLVEQAVALDAHEDLVYAGGGRAS